MSAGSDSRAADRRPTRWVALTGRAALVGFASLGLARQGLADDARAQPEFAVEYRAAAGCPASAEFEAAVVSRVPGARVVPMERASVRFRVVLSDATQGTSSSISIELADGTSSSRTVSDASCADAAASMAVIAAMVLDGRRLPDDAASAPAVATESARSPPRAATKPTAPKRKAELAENVAATPGADMGDTADRERSTAARVRAGAALAATWESEVAPSAPLGMLASLEARWELETIWSPSLRLGLLYTASASETSEDGVATFQLVAARASVCLLRLGNTRSFALFACADVDAGQLWADGSHTLNERTQTMLWLAAGPAVRAELPLGRLWAVEALLGARALAQHDRFVFQPGAEIHDVARFSVGLGIGVSARLP